MAALEGEVREAVDKFVEADILNEDVREATFKQVLEALDQKRIEMLDLVLHLEKALNDHTNPSSRRNAIQLLSECLRDATQLKLNFKHVETFANFFVSKLGDWQCVEGAVGGISVLLRKYGSLVRTLKHTGEDEEEAMAVYLARSLFKEVHTPSHTQAVRRMVLETIELLLDDWKEELKQLGPKLGEGVSASIEEERDPRNLLVSFTIARKVLGEFPDESVDKDVLVTIFETLVSYFPITFTPPKGDKIGITGDDLRFGLGNALGASLRLAENVVPFLLDASKDLESDAEETIKQASSMLASCLGQYGPKVAQAHLKEIFETTRDQVCRTSTTCGADFCDMVKSSLAIAMRGVPAGLHPHWLSKDVAAALKTLATDASKGQTSLACDGSRSLLLAAAASHPVLLQCTWGAVVPLLLASTESKPKGTTDALPLDSLSFVLELAGLAGKGVLSPKQVKPALAGSVEILCCIRPGMATLDSGEGDESQKKTPDEFPTAVELVGVLCCLAGEAASGDAFRALRLALLPGAGGGSSSSSDVWSNAWRAELAGASETDVLATALVNAVCTVTSTQPARAAELAPALLDLPASGASYVEWLPAALPKLLAATSVSLACEARAKEGDETAAQAAESTASALLTRAADLFRLRRPEDRFDVLAAFGKALAEKPGQLEWAASRLAAALELPGKLSGLVEGITSATANGGSLAVAVAKRAEAARSFVCEMSRQLPAAEAEALRLSVPTAAAGAKGQQLADLVGVLPGVLPDACQEHWATCSRAVPAVCRCASGSEPGLNSAAEQLALEALEVLVERCPEKDVPALLQTFRDSFGQFLKGGGKASDSKAARGAACCWAAATGALLRRPGSAKQASMFLEALLQALDEAAPVGPFVPVAFQVLAPVQVDTGGPNRAKLPALALQQLSATVLPSLESRAKDSAREVWARRAALECAVSLLCALPEEVASADCGDVLRWCTLTGLKRLREDTAGANQAEGAFFGVQTLQLLVRANRRSLDWVEDELHSIVIPICEVGVKHQVPLVRLACFQVVMALMQQSHGHMAPFRKQLQEALRRGIEDSCREVRLLAVAALNSWHCANSSG